MIGGVRPPPTRSGHEFPDADLSRPRPCTGIASTVIGGRSTCTTWSRSIGLASTFRSSVRHCTRQRSATFPGKGAAAEWCRPSRRGTWIRSCGHLCAGHQAFPRLVGVCCVPHYLRSGTAACFLFRVKQYVCATLPARSCRSSVRNRRLPRRGQSCPIPSAPHSHPKVRYSASSFELLSLP